MRIDQKRVGAQRNLAQAGSNLWLSPLPMRRVPPAARALPPSRERSQGDSSVHGRTVCSCWCLKTCCLPLLRVRRYPALQTAVVRSSDNACEDGPLPGMPPSFSLARCPDRPRAHHLNTCPKGRHAITVASRAGCSPVAEPKVAPPEAASKWSSPERQPSQICEG